MFVGALSLAPYVNVSLIYYQLVRGGSITEYKTQFNPVRNCKSRSKYLIRYCRILSLVPYKESSSCECLVSYLHVNGGSNT